jgi:hypothetical protein
MYLKAGLLARSQYVSGRSSDPPTRSKFSAALLGPGEHGGLVQYIKSTWHCMLSMQSSISNFLSRRSTPTVTKFRHNAALQTQNSAQMLNFFPLLHTQTPIFHQLTFFTSQRSTLPPAYLYQKNEWA